jgi:predicted PurR-regulated permease PerM
MSDTTYKTTSVLITLAALVVIIAGMKAAAAIVVPFIFSVFIAIICAPPLVWMTRRRVPAVLAVLIILFAILLIGVLLSLAIGTSIEQFTNALPGYQANLQAQFNQFINWVSGLGIEISKTGIKESFDPASAIEFANKLLDGLGSLFTHAFLIIFTVLFILLEASSFPVKLKAVVTQSNFKIDYVDHFFKSVQRYVGLKTITSFATGVLVSIMMAILGVDFPVLWGLLAFLLNYIPNIGSIIAAVPAVLLALVQFGVPTALGAALGYAVINVLIGSVIEPRIMGRGMGLSALIVFLSLIFWGWVFGPTGMILSVPLTMLAKLALESREETNWIAVLLGTGTPEQVTEKSNGHE